MHAFKINYCKLFASIRFEAFSLRSSMNIPRIANSNIHRIIYRQTPSTEHTHTKFMLANKFPDEISFVFACIRVSFAFASTIRVQCKRQVCRNTMWRATIRIINMSINANKKERTQTYTKWQRRAATATAVADGVGGVWTNKCYHLFIVLSISLCHRRLHIRCGFSIFELLIGCLHRLHYLSNDFYRVNYFV